MVLRIILLQKAIGIGLLLLQTFSKCSSASLCSLRAAVEFAKINSVCLGNLPTKWTVVWVRNLPSGATGCGRWRDMFVLKVFANTLVSSEQRDVKFCLALYAEKVISRCGEIFGHLDGVKEYVTPSWPVYIFVLQTFSRDRRWNLTTENFHNSCLFCFFKQSDEGNRRCKHVQVKIV